MLTFAARGRVPGGVDPYFYATELLSTGAGRLVGLDDHEAMAAAVSELLGDEASLDSASHAALELGAQYTWPEVGRETLKVLGEAARGLDGGRPESGVTRTRCCADPSARPTSSGWSMPAASCSTPSGLEPDPSTGYCVDDVARLGMVAAGLHEGTPDGATGRRWPAGAPTSWSRRGTRDVARCATSGRSTAGGSTSRMTETTSAGPSGRSARWGCGSSPLAAAQQGPAPRRGRGRPGAEQPRSASFAILGLARLPVDLLPAEERQLLRRLGAISPSLYEAHASPEWQWFEDELTYDNGRLAQALVAAGASRRDADQVRLGLEALEWYCGQCAADSDAVVLVGNHWRRRDAAPVGSDEHSLGDEGDEQPLDAAALVEACVEAFRVTGSPTYCRRARDAFAWFHGRNRWGLASTTRPGAAATTAWARMASIANEGAESTLAYLQAWLALDVGRPGPVRSDGVKVALLGPIAWRTPPEHYGPWEQVTGLLADGLADRGVDVTLFATRRLA